MNLWVYKCRNDPGTPFPAWGDWSEVFANPWKKQPWGGAWATAKPNGKEIFNNEIQTGDLVLAWQSNRHAAIGVCEVTGRKRSRYGGTDVVLLPIEKFAEPVRLHDLKKTSRLKLQTISALRPGNVATIYRTTHQEARLLLAACGATSAKRLTVTRPKQ